MNQLLTINEATKWAARFLNKQVSTSNISYLIQYGRIKKFGKDGEVLWEVFKKMRVIVPPMELIKVFQQKTHPMFEEIVFLNKKNGVLRQDRDMLLPKLISGEIDVSNFR